MPGIYLWLRNRPFFAEIKAFFSATPAGFTAMSEHFLEV